MLRHRSSSLMRRRLFHATLKTDAYVAGNGDFFRLGTRDAPSSSVTFVPVHCDPENGNESNNTNNICFCFSNC